MKRIIILLGVISLFVFKMAGQGNLQFNRVINIDLEGTCTNTIIPNFIDTVILVVPVGKVVKLESITAGSERISDNQISSSYTSVVIDKMALSIDSFPMWLKEGQYVFNCRCGIAGFIGFARITGIEFNITPP